MHAIPCDMYHYKTLKIKTYTYRAQDTYEKLYLVYRKSGPGCISYLREGAFHPDVLISTPGFIICP